MPFKDVNGYKFTISRFDLSWFDKYLKRAPKVILEFGSYDGGDGVLYKNSFPNCRVISIEACPERYTIVEKNADKFGIESYNYAVCDFDGKIDFFQVEDTISCKNNSYESSFGSSGSINSRTDVYKVKFPHVKEKPSILIDSVRLDTFCEMNEVKNIDLLHCDVEGAEHKVIAGMGSLRPKLLWLEVHLGKEFYGENAYDPVELNSVLRDMGYIMVESNGSDNLYELR